MTSVKEMNTSSIFMSSTIMLFSLVFLLSGCRPAPAGQVVKALIEKHFETEKYHVVEIRMGDITPLSLGGKTYMGTPGYLVDIRSITLEIRQDIGAQAAYRKGQHVTFTNARVSIKEQSGPTGKWVITRIEGIPVP
jgi:hypothetical protein